jgi:NitT/TauT family transport system permease protein
VTARPPRQAPPEPAPPEPGLGTGRRGLRRDGAAARAIGAAIGIAGLLALWQALHLAYGDLVLPGVWATARRIVVLIVAGEALPAAARTAGQALLGFAVAAALGTVAGLAAGRLPWVDHVLRPVATLVLGVPAIGWVVLALLWVGPMGSAPALTVALTTTPLVLLAAAEGAAGLDRDLMEMARAFRAPRRLVLARIVAPQLFVHLMPAFAAALGVAWKVAVMAEVLGGGTGIGDRLALTRVNLDTEGTMAWIVLAVAMLLAVELGVLEPVRRRLERWRPPDRDGAGTGRGRS